MTRNRTLALRLASAVTTVVAGTLTFVGAESTAAAQSFGAPPPPQTYTVQAGPNGGYVSGGNGNYRARVESGTNPAEKFSRQGHLAISNDASFGFTVEGNNAPASKTGVAFVIKPAADYFVIDNLSVGGYVRLGFANDAGVGLNDGGNTTFGVGARVGYNIPIAQNFSIWPRAGLGVNTASLNTTVNNVDVSVSQTNLTLNLSVPFLVHPVDHYFLGLAPALDVDLTGDTKTTAFSINFVVGGWIL